MFPASRYYSRCVFHNFPRVHLKTCHPLTRLYNTKKERQYEVPQKNHNIKEVKADDRISIPWLITAGLMVIIGGALFDVFSNKKVEFEKSLDSDEMYKLIDKLVDQADAEALLRLIRKLKDCRNNFPNINFRCSWQKKIRDAIILKRDLALIEIIFPKLTQATLSSYCEIYYSVIEKGDVEFMKVLFENGLSKIQMDRYWQPKDFFLYSIEKKQFKLAKFFLETGFYDINKSYYHQLEFLTGEKMRNYYTAAYIAVGLNDPETLSWLINEGANATGTNQLLYDEYSYRWLEDLKEDRNNPLTLAIQMGYEECFEIIINTQNIDIEVIDYDKRTPLIHALRCNRFEMAQKLVEKGANTNAIGNRCITRLFRSRTSSKIHLIKKFISSNQIKKN